MGSQSVLGCRAGDGLDITADSRDDFPVSHVVIDVPFEAFYQSRERDARAQNRTLIEMVIEPRRGTYTLILSCERNARIQIGRLGKMQLQPGYYVYVGSALGAAGLRARIAHHQKLTSRPHWHIDYLRPHTRLHSVWLNYDGKRHEHKWAHAIHNVKDAMVPLPGFGTSDCSCPSHLYFFKHSPTRLMSMKTPRLWGCELVIGHFRCQSAITCGGGDG